MVGAALENHECCAVVRSSVSAEVAIDWPYFLPWLGSLSSDESALAATGSSCMVGTDGLAL